MNFKEKCLEFETNTESDLIITCLNNNSDYSMINQLNLVTYAGSLYDLNNINFYNLMYIFNFNFFFNLLTNN